MYHFIDRFHTLYGLLQDEQSKKIFQARFAIDMEPSIPNIKCLVSLGSCRNREFLGWNQSRLEKLRKLNREHKKIILYGTASTGHAVAKMLKFEKIDFYGFCGRGAKKFPDGMLGKPVLSPDYLVTHGDEYYVMPTISAKTYPEISRFLKENSYPEDHILDWVDVFASDDKNQYFEFPKLYRRGTAFIDAGCYDCGSSYRFAEWCEGAYSSIIAFEPDPDNFAMCSEKIRNVPLLNFQIINAGLSSQEGTAVFNAKSTSGSHIISVGSSDEPNVSQVKTENEISIHTVAIDNIVGDRTVGFIKMDIEGAEFDALHGAKNTIIRDKPFLAICVYHLRGDTFAIMDYLHQLLPEYRFWLRHYSTRDAETVLYASIDM